MDKKRYYIAYGSNLNLEQMKMRCPTAEVVGVSELKGYKLVFKGALTNAYATIEDIVSRHILIKLRTFPSLAYSDKYIPAPIPIGTVISKEINNI